METMTVPPPPGKNKPLYAHRGKTACPQAWAAGPEFLALLEGAVGKVVHGKNGVRCLSSVACRLL